MSFLMWLYWAWFPPSLDVYDDWPVRDPFETTNRLPCVSGCNTHN